jgi:hypothetical protein
MYYPPPKNDSTKIILIVVLVVVILVVVVPIILALVFLSSTPMMTGTDTSPVGALHFTESSPGFYAGGIVSLSDRVDVDDASLLIIDDSLGQSATLDPLGDHGTAQVNSGISCTFTDTNSNGRLDAGDVFSIENGATGDVIRLIHRPTDRLIAEYTLQ